MPVRIARVAGHYTPLRRRQRNEDPGNKHPLHPSAPQPKPAPGAGGQREDISSPGTRPRGASGRRQQVTRFQDVHGSEQETDGREADVSGRLQGQVRPLICQRCGGAAAAAPAGEKHLQTSGETPQASDATQCCCDSDQAMAAEAAGSSGAAAEGARGGAGLRGLRHILRHQRRSRSSDKETSVTLETYRKRDWEAEQQQKPPAPPELVHRVDADSPLRYWYPWADEELLSRLEEFNFHLPWLEGERMESSGSESSIIIAPPKLRLSLPKIKRSRSPSSSWRSARCTEVVNADVAFDPFTPYSEEEMEALEAAAAAAAAADADVPSSASAGPAPSVPAVVTPVVNACAGMVALTSGLPMTGRAADVSLQPPPSPAAPASSVAAAVSPMVAACANLVAVTTGLADNVADGASKEKSALDRREVRLLPRFPRERLEQQQY